MINSKPRATAIGIVFLLLSVSACQPDLQGTWSGYDSGGEAVSLTFGTNRSLQIVTPAGDVASSLPGGTLKYDVLDEVYPKQLYMVVEMGDTLQHREPLGIYKIEGGRLVICQPRVTQRTISFIPVGEPSYEWPTEFRGDCYGLDRS